MNDSVSHTAARSQLPRWMDHTILLATDHVPLVSQHVDCCMCLMTIPGVLFSNCPEQSPINRKFHKDDHVSSGLGQ